jgi:hypothetical protein
MEPVRRYRYVYRSLRLAAALGFIALVTVPLAACAAPTAPPEIVSLESRSRVVAPGDSVLVECIASSTGGDELTYEWAADRGTINGYAGVVAWTAPSQEGLARISVTVGNGGRETATQSVTVVVKSNKRPVISGLTPESDWVRPGESVMIHCSAEDGDGDPLTYEWTATCGHLSGDGPTVTWTAPDIETSCQITVVVDDGFDGRATASVSIVSSEHEPLLISSVTVTAVNEPYYLVSRTDWHKVYWEDTYIIECFVPEPDRIVSYEWSDGGPAATFPVGADRIVFEGGPSRIRWTAPKVREELTMTVTVKDAAGNSASKSITLYVDTCTCAFPQG